MRRVTAIVGILILCTAGIGFAHAPAKVNLSLDEENTILHVRFEHRVRDAAQHFVYRVTVRLNDKEIIDQTLGRQDDETGGSLLYRIAEAKPGDTIEVRVRCNKGGSKTGKITVEKP